MANTLTAILNGQLVPAHTAALGISDLSIQRGYGIFDYFKTVNHQPVFLNDHLDRFYHSAEHMRLAVGYNRTALTALLQELMDHNNLAQSGIRITLTGGYAADGYTPGTPNLIITQQPMEFLPFDQQPLLSFITHAHQRQMPGVKTIDYLMAVWLQPLIKERGANDVLYYHNNLIAECPRANIFVVRQDGSVVTPANNMLKGIIRTRLLCHFGSQVNITEGDISLTEVYNAAEVFITSSSKNIAPVVQVDGRQIGNGQPGPVTTMLAAKLTQLIAEQTAGCQP